MAKKTSSKKNEEAPPAVDRRPDLIGVLLTAGGILTAVGLLGNSSSRVVVFILRILRQGFGWGVYFLPIVMIGIGIWLLLRRLETLPRLTWERGAGIALLTLAVLTWLHFFSFPLDFNDSRMLAASGIGGGFLGALLLTPLQSAFGVGGAAVALTAWSLLSLSLALDVPVLDLFDWVPGVIDVLRTLFRKLFPKRKALPDLPVETASSPGGEDLERVVLPSAVPEIPAASPQLNWVLPHIPDILNIGQDIEPNEEFDQHRASIIEETLDSFGAPGTVVEINRGPTITQFGVEPDFIESRGRKRRVRVSKITGLSDDLALALAARRIRIEAPVPGKGYVGIEVPNEEITLVALRDLIQDQKFKRMKSPLKFALGRDVSGDAFTADLTSMPHLLIAGTTGSGKSVCVNALISCFLLHNTPDQLRMIMVDPKRVELSGYDGIPHLLAPVVVDLERVVGVLQWVSREMDQRYHKFSQSGARHIRDYNQKMEKEDGQSLPYLVVLIDELADLMMLAPTETERAITRLAQLARATGIHLIISTQRPSTNVVTGLIKANFPARIAFATASGVDSRVILDQPGAETLLGRGDMLFQAPDAAAPVRLQGVFVSDDEINRLVRYWQFLSAQIRAPRKPTAAEGKPDVKLPRVPLKQKEMFEEMKEQEDRDPLWDQAVELIREEDRASISMLQRRLRIGYTRAARLIDQLAAAGIVGPPQDGPTPRDVIDPDQAEDSKDQA